MIMCAKGQENDYYPRMQLRINTDYVISLSNCLIVKAIICHGKHKKQKRSEITHKRYRA